MEYEKSIHKKTCKNQFLKRENLLSKFDLFEIYHQKEK